MTYLAHTPFWMRLLYPAGVTWTGDPEGNKVYLTFDDGPVPGPTEFVLDELKRFGFKATFFCIGDNVRKHSCIFKRIIDEGHAMGNHTMHHLNGWKTSADDYVTDIIEADKLIASSLFRPPYGRITREQVRRVKELAVGSWRLADDRGEMTGDRSRGNQNSDADDSMPGAEKTGRKIILWSVLTGDFDPSIDGNICFERVKKYTRAGSIIVMHDSEKALPRLQTALPKILAWLKEQRFQPAIFK